MSPNVLRKLRAVDDAQKAKDGDPRVVEVRRHIDRCVALAVAELRPEFDRRILG